MIIQSSLWLGNRSTQELKSSLYQLRFEPELFLSTIEKHQVSQAHLVPPVQRLPCPLLSHALTKSGGEFTDACILLESTDANKKNTLLVDALRISSCHPVAFHPMKIDVLLEWSKASVSITQYASGVSMAEAIAAQTTVH